MDFSYLDDWAEEEPVAAMEAPAEGYRNIWVVALLAGDDLHPASLEAMGRAREMADQVGIYALGILLGENVEALGPTLVEHGADRVLVADSPGLAAYQPEAYVNILAGLVDEQRPEALILPAMALGSDLAPRLAQRLDTGLMSHCIRLEMDLAERLLLGTYPVLGGEMYHTAACPAARPQMATLEPGAYPRPYPDAYRNGDVQRVEFDAGDLAEGLAWLDMDAWVELPPVPLSRAGIVVAGGRGMGDAAGFALVEQLAGALGGAVAGSRGALDAGWIDAGQVVGVGGATVAPEVYLACGLSGVVYHAFGLEGAKYVLAINRDEEAPMMKRANLALVGDAREVIAAMLEALAS